MIRKQKKPSSNVQQGWLCSWRCQCQGLSALCAAAAEGGCCPSLCPACPSCSCLWHIPAWCWSHQRGCQAQQETAIPAATCPDTWKHIPHTELPQGEATKILPSLPKLWRDSEQVWDNLIILSLSPPKLHLPLSSLLSFTEPIPWDRIPTQCGSSPSYRLSALHSPIPH